MNLASCRFGLAMVMVGVPAGAQLPKQIINQQVVAMIRLGLPEPAIVAAIGAGPVNFDLAPATLVRLHQEGVDATILDAMMRAEKARPAGAGTAGMAGSGSPLGAKPGSAKPNPAAARAAVAKLMSARRPLTVVTVNQPASPAEAATLAALQQQHVAAQASARPALGAGPVRTSAAPVAASASRLGARSVVSAPAMDACMAVSSGAIIQGLAQASPAAPAVFTQDPKYNPVAVTGCHFGRDQGSAYLKNASGVKVADLGIPLGGWSDTQIKLTMDPALVDVMDQDNLTLVVVPAAGPMAQKAGFKFHAMRREIHLVSIPKSAVALAGIADSAGAAVKSTYTSPYAGLSAGLQQQGFPANSYGTTDQGMTAGTDRYDWYRFGAGTDTFDFHALKPEFVVSRFQIDEQNLEYCTEGDNLLIGEVTDYSDGRWQAHYDAGQNRLIVSFAEKHCHETNGSDDSNSTYALDVWVTGPAVSPTFNPWQGDAH